MTGKRFNKKGLKKRLATMMMIYMDGLSEKKKQKLNDYTVEKLGPIIDYYVRLLKGRKGKKIKLPFKTLETINEQQLAKTTIQTS